MFKKLITLMLAFSIFAVQAQASAEHGLKAAFDELNYSLTAEWDQQDQHFYDTQVQKFTATVRELQAEGLTNAQLLAFAKSEIKDAKAAKDLEAALIVVEANKMSSAEASDYLMQSMKKSYASGASWNGRWVGDAAILVGFVGISLLCIYALSCHSGNDSCEE